MPVSTELDLLRANTPELRWLALGVDGKPRYVDCDMDITTVVVGFSPRDIDVSIWGNAGTGKAPDMLGMSKLVSSTITIDPD